jgi:DNA repair exonuclease SbcCD ATPase subunit
MPTVNFLFDQYHLKFGSSNGIAYTRVLLINNKKRFVYRSVIHEFICCLETGEITSAVIDGDYYVVSGRSGSRSQDPQKYLKDAQILEKAYEEAIKTNDQLYMRYAFYCANSYKDYGMDVLSKGGPPYRKALAMPALFKVQLAIGTESAELKQVKLNKAKIQAQLNETVPHFDASSRAIPALEAQRERLTAQRTALDVPRIARGDTLPGGRNRWGNGADGDNAFGLALAAREARIAANRPNIDRVANQIRQLDAQLAAARAELAKVQAKLEALLESAGREKDDLRKLVLELTREVAELRVKVEFFESNRRL